MLYLHHFLQQHLYSGKFGDEELIDVMDKTMNGENVYPDSTPDVQIGNISSDMFTPKELEVLSYLVQNMGLHEIADKMGVAYTTVRSPVKNLTCREQEIPRLYRWWMNCDKHGIYLYVTLRYNVISLK